MPIPNSLTGSARSDSIDAQRSNLKPELLSSRTAAFGIYRSRSRSTLLPGLRKKVLVRSRPVEIKESLAEPQLGEHDG